MMDVIFQEHPDVVIGSNTFRNVKTILQYEEFPLIQVGKFVQAGYTTQFDVYNSDGVQIAVVKGAQVHLTDHGKGTSIKPRYEPNLTVCEVEGKPIFELRRIGAAALKGWAELFAPEGVLVKVQDTMGAIRHDGTQIRIGGAVIEDSVFDGHDIGILVTRDSIRLGGPGGRAMQADLGTWTATGKGGGSVTITRDGTGLLRAEGGGPGGEMHTRGKPRKDA